MNERITIYIWKWFSYCSSYYNMHAIYLYLPTLYLLYNYNQSFKNVEEIYVPHTGKSTKINACVYYIPLCTYSMNESRLGFFFDFYFLSRKNLNFIETEIHWAGNPYIQYAANENHLRFPLSAGDFFNVL